MSNIGSSTGCLSLGFFFQAEDGIRDAQESRGLGDVYKRQVTSNRCNARVCDVENAHHKSKM